MPKNILDGLSSAFPPDKLNPQALLELVATLTERVETLTAAVERLERAAQEAPRLTGGVEEVYKRAAASGVDLDRRLHDALQLAERFSAQGTAEGLSALLDRVDRLQPLLALVERAGASLPPVLDALEAVARRLREEGLVVEEVVAGGAAAALRLGARLAPEQLASLESLLSAGSLDALSRLGRALAAGGRKPPAPLGLMGLVRSAADPHVQRALGFLVQVARELGQTLDAPR